MSTRQSRRWRSYRRGRYARRLGTVYNALGEKQKAFDHFNQSLLITEAWVIAEEKPLLSTTSARFITPSATSRRRWTTTNGRFAHTRRWRSQSRSRYSQQPRAHYNSIGAKQEALDYFNQSLPLRRSVGDRRGEATTLYNLGLFIFVGEM